LGYAGAADPFVLMLLAHCDGRASLGQVIETLARESGVKLDELRAPALAVVTKLIEQGFLEAVEHSVE
jgi:hypothetical protein